MSTADRLLELISSWIENKELCADQLRKLARELESLRENCNAGECVDSSMLGASCLIGSGVAMLSAGAAADFFRLLRAASTAASVAAQITEGFLSSDTMKDVKEVEKRSNNIVDEIQQLFKKLKDEAKAANPSANPDELDRHITAEILTVMARRSGVRGGVSIYWFRGEPRMFLDGVKQLVTQTVLKGGAKVVGGAVGMAFALDEAIDNWTDMINNNRVTEASQSLRDTANAIRRVAEKLREQLDSIRRTLDKMAKRQREEEEKKKRQKLSREKNTQNFFVVFFLVIALTVHLKQSAVDSHGNKNTHDECQSNQRYRYGQEGDGYEWSSEKKRDSGQSIKTGGQAPGGDDPGDKKSDCQNITIDLPKNVSMALLNVNSIPTHLSPVSDLINESQLQVLFLTETWLRTDTGDDVLREGLPEGFQFFQQPRGSRGGGVAIVFSEELEAERISLGSYTSFEYLAVVLNHQRWHQPMLTITLYRPPGYNINEFLKEFQSLLDQVSNQYKNTLVIGDFNIWVDVENRKPTGMFRELLEDNDLHQHVKEPTFTRSNHTLDLVISRNVDVSDLSIPNENISDHKTVLFSATPEKEEEN